MLSEAIEYGRESGKLKANSAAKAHAKDGTAQSSYASEYSRKNNDKSNSSELEDLKSL